ncbi:hypothetical protein Glove_230g20 [Diversispora epigaea]|uniref:Protein kinase domain-containing protein n=1 Tax=Diversispora epigaea TaxID=1348612 RepID=A0A397IKN3_9GLOM|nr:hypothetical protein Glove_230g20 [Diversispora epigaea]
MHKDFHPGNIANQTLVVSYIIDFGLCKPVTENDPEKVYGVIPYMAPETLSRGEYTQASDIYSFGMVMLEVLTSYPPYYNIAHDANLAIKICWNFEPLNRPTAEELRSQLAIFCHNDRDSEIRNKLREQNLVAIKSNKNFIQYNPSVMHPEEIYTSRYLPFLKSKKFETHDTKQWDFVIPDDIIEENEIQEN